jgi:hypothetical protein
MGPRSRVGPAEIGELERRSSKRSKLERERQTQQQRLARAEARLAEIEQALAAWDGRDRLLNCKPSWPIRLPAVTEPGR